MQSSIRPESLCEFQLTRPRGTRHLLVIRLLRQLSFSTHASAWDATSPLHRPEILRQFQLTRPRGTRHAFAHLFDSLTHFNSRVRAGRDHLEVNSITKNLFISTHASARDATLYLAVLPQPPRKIWDFFRLRLAYSPLFRAIVDANLSDIFHHRRFATSSKPRHQTISTPSES